MPIYVRSCLSRFLGPKTTNNKCRNLALQVGSVSLLRWSTRKIPWRLGFNVVVMEGCATLLHRKVRQRPTSTYGQWVAYQDGFRCQRRGKSLYFFPGRPSKDVRDFLSTSTSQPQLTQRNEKDREIAYSKSRSKQRRITTPPFFRSANIAHFH